MIRAILFDLDETLINTAVFQRSEFAVQTYLQLNA